MVKTKMFSRKHNWVKGYVKDEEVLPLIGK